MSVGFILPILLIFSFFTTVFFVYAKSDKRNDTRDEDESASSSYEGDEDDEEDNEYRAPVKLPLPMPRTNTPGSNSYHDHERERASYNTSELENKLKNLEAKLIQNEQLYSHMMRSFETQLLDERKGNDENKNRLREIEIERDRQSQMLRENEMKLRNEIEEHRSLQEQLTRERHEKKANEERLKLLEARLEAESNKQSLLLSQKENELRDETDRMRVLEERLSRIRSENDDRFKSMETQLEAERARRQQQLLEKENELRAERAKLTSLETQLTAAQTAVRNQNSQPSVNPPIPHTRQHQPPLPQQQQQQQPLPKQRQPIHLPQPPYFQLIPQPRHAISGPTSPTATGERNTPPAGQSPSLSGSQPAANRGAMIHSTVTGKSNAQRIQDEKNARVNSIAENNPQPLPDAANSMPHSNTAHDNTPRPPANNNNPPAGATQSAAPPVVNTPPATQTIPIEQRFVKVNEIEHDSKWVDVSTLSVVMTPEMVDAVASCVGSKDIANKYCIMKILNSALPSGQHKERKVRKSLQVGESGDSGKPKRYARMKIIMKAGSTASMVFHDYTPVVKEYVHYDFATDTVTDQRGCVWRDFDVPAVYLGAEQLSKIGSVSLLLKPDKVLTNAKKPNPPANNKNTGPKKPSPKHKNGKTK